MITKGEFAELRGGLIGAADPAKAAPMGAYIKNHFQFFGVTSPERRKVTKPIIALAMLASPDAVLDFAEACWGEPKREFQYVAVDALRAGAANLRASDLDRVRSFIERKSWWDTVDLLAAWTVGPMVADSPELTGEMDRWIDDADMWIARTAILHQLGYKGRTDAERLFLYCDKRGADTEFFIRKALGWALRQYARTDPDAVRTYVESNAERLSGLTKREALKHLSDRPNNGA